MKENSKLTASQQDYLESIYLLSRDKTVARAKEIADSLDVSASSVTAALRTLGSMNLVNYEPYGLISLTPEGRLAAEEIVGRHRALKEFLSEVLGVEAEEADEAACRMEHSVPDTITERLIKYVECVKGCSKGGITWDQELGFFCCESCRKSDCERDLPRSKKR